MNINNKEYKRAFLRMLKNANCYQEFFIELERFGTYNKYNFFTRVCCSEWICDSFPWGESINHDMRFWFEMDRVWRSLYQKIYSTNHI